MPSLNHKSGLAWGSNQVLCAVRELCNHCQQQAWKRRQPSIWHPDGHFFMAPPFEGVAFTRARCCQRPGRCRIEPHSGGRSGLLHKILQEIKGRLQPLQMRSKMGAIAHCTPVCSILQAGAHLGQRYRPLRDRGGQLTGLRHGGEDPSYMRSETQR